MEADQDHKTIRINILLTGSQTDKLAQAARARGISKAAYVRFALEQAFRVDEGQSLQKAVRELAPLYQADSELTPFTALDSEDFV
jgi:hypothetical protein